MHHKIRHFSNSAQDFRDCLVQSLVETIPEVSAKKVLDLAVDLKANVDIGEFMDTFKYKRKRHFVAKAFRNDIWLQIKTLIKSQKQKPAFYERLLLSLHGKEKAEEQKRTFYERLLLFLHGKKKTEKEQTLEDLLQEIAKSYSDESGRILLAISFIGFCIRLLQVFASFSQIGPLLIMIARMLIDTFYFLGVLIVVVISYAVSSRAILYPNTEFTWPSLYTTFRKPYWHIFGELFLDELEGDAKCGAVGILANSTALCPSAMARYVIPVMLGVYMIIVQLLLINLLIAKFTKTFDKVYDNTIMHWRFL
ncbi:transient receptor potential cation channel subfamily M member 5-like [Mya arenaria]|uniref:transient receptor potential cation channel subfamily M member 5-like n=1 Tax=Mya arenaria TaxID=6604 RepID=UPI0022E40E0A|nr:transient receptor potential cation channel subfamily M member 5-like [Mya arenaria]